MADGSITISITGDSGDIESKLKKVDTDIKNLGDDAEASGDKGSKLGQLVAAGMKAAMAATAAAAAGVAALTKLSVSSYADYEQLVGGVETLFSNLEGTVSAAPQVLANAERAWQTAGMSANAYMETVMSFSAALVSSLEGDYTRAAAISDMAVQDMSDNVNKMGSSMQSIQDAYQGFAKQNYTMLDNLKLGYGGTKSEMERLLADAEKLTGIKYDINNLADVYEAIHAIQTQLGITGTTAAEAANTISGSAAAAKAAWSNVLTDLADENANLGESLNIALDATGVAIENVVPRIQQTLEGIGQAFEYLVPILIQQAPAMIMQLAPGMISAVGSLISSVGSAFVQYGPSLLQSAVDTATQLIDGLSSGLASGIPTFLSQALPMVTEFSGQLRSNAGQLVDSALTLVENLAQGIANSLPVLIENIPTIITNIAGIINDNAPKLLVTGLEIIGTLAQGIIQAIPTLIANIPQILQAIISVFSAFNWVSLGNMIVDGVKTGVSLLGTALKDAATNAINAFTSGSWIATGGQVVSMIANAIHGAVGMILSALRSIGTNGLNAFRSINWASVGKAAINFIANAAKGAVGLAVSALKSVGASAMNAFKSINWGALGRNIVTGIINGIGGAAGALFSKLRSLASSALSAAKSALGIHSPSRVFRDAVGRWIPAGIAEGIDQHTGDAVAAAKRSAQGIISAATLQSAQLTLVSGTGAAAASTANTYQYFRAGDHRVINYSQIFNSPKAMTRREILRQTENIVKELKTA